MNTTNARSENLTESGGMWASIKGKRRCVVVCQGLVTHPPRVSSQGALTHTHTHIYNIYFVDYSYFEWLKKGKERFPHFTKHKSGHLMLLAGLYDRAMLDGMYSLRVYAQSNWF